MSDELRMCRALVGDFETWTHLSARAIGGSVSLNRAVVTARRHGITTADELIFMSAEHARALAGQLIAAAREVPSVIATSSGSAGISKWTGGNA